MIRRDLLSAQHDNHTFAMKGVRPAPSSDWQGSSSALGFHVRRVSAQHNYRRRPSSIATRSVESHEKFVPSRRCLPSQVFVG
jgi:hypothetical protein